MNVHTLGEVLWALRYVIGFVAVVMVAVLWWEHKVVLPREEAAVVEEEDPYKLARQIYRAYSEEYK